MRHLVKPILLTVVLALAFAVGSTPVGAQTIDDPPLFIGNAATCPASTCPNLYNGETIGLNSNALTIYDQGAASHTTDPTIILLIAIPNSTSGAPAISSVSVGFVNPPASGPPSGSPSGTLGGTNVLGGSWNTSTGLGGNNGGKLTSTFPPKSGSVYPVAGLPTGAGGASSESFGNFQTWDANAPGIGITVDPTTGFFGVFAYTITGVSLGQGQYLIVNFAGSGLPLGTFAVGFSCETGDIQCATKGLTGDIYSTPFTHAGLVDSGPTPEPASLALLGTGILALGTAVRRRMKGSPQA